MRMKFYERLEKYERISLHFENLRTAWLSVVGATIGAGLITETIPVVMGFCFVVSWFAVLVAICDMQVTIETDIRTMKRFEQQVKDRFTDT
jgi:hypothetical protein